MIARDRPPCTPTFMGSFHHGHTVAPMETVIGLSKALSDGFTRSAISSLEVR